MIVLQVVQTVAVHFPAGQQPASCGRTGRPHCTGHAHRDSWCQVISLATDHIIKVWVWALSGWETVASSKR